MADLNNGTYWSEVDASNNSASPNGWPEGMMPSGVNDAARADKGALKRFWDRINPITQITPSGGLWTFTTSNPSYPAAYVDGEVFTFATAFASSSGDQFRVNALPAKPIMVQRNGVWGTIAAYDIVSSHTPVLIHLSTLNAGAGGFALVNPHVPVLADGTPYGGSMSGNLTVAGSIQSNSTAATALYAPSGGVAANVISGNSLTITGAGSFGGPLNVTGAGQFNGALTLYGTGYTALNVASGGITSAARVTSNDAGLALYAPTGNLQVGGAAAVGGALTVNGTGSFGGAVTISTGGFALNLTGGGISAVGFIQTTAAGRAFYAPNGNLEIGGTGFIGGNTTIAGTLSVTGTTTHSGAVTISAGGTSLNVGGDITAPGVVTAGGFSTAGSIGGTSATLQYLTLSGTGTALALTSGTGAKPGGGTWTDISDIRTKDADSIADYTTGLAAVCCLRPRTFRKNGRGGTIADGKTYIGFVADEALPIMPETIGRIVERLDPDDDEPTDILTLDATALLFALTNAVRELAAEINALKSGEPHAADGPTPQHRPHRR